MTTEQDSLTSLSAPRLLLNEVTSAGSCSHPIRLLGQTVNLATGELDTRVVKVPCKDRRAVICPSCSSLYQADAWILVASGLNGGKGVPATVAEHPRLFVTLTAPSFGSVHRARSTDGRCRPGGSHRRCAHGRPRWCAAVHATNDNVLGSPLCDRCFDYQGAVLWNAGASKLWNRTVTQLRRTLAAEAGLNERELGTVARLSYLKVAEIQQRGLIHFHAILRLDGPRGSCDPPPTSLTAGLLATHVREAIAWTRATDAKDIGAWGTQFDIHDVSAAASDDRRIAAYLAKYASKTTDGSLDFARRFTTRSEIERLDAPTHRKTLALTAWDLGSSGLEHLHLSPVQRRQLRAHAHSFGFAGQLITKSRSYSTTFSSLRGARTEHRSRATASDPVQGTFGFVGRGYDDPKAEQLAEAMFEARKELRQARSGTVP